MTMRIFSALLILFTMASAQQSLDKIIAIVDREIITESDLNFMVQHCGAELS
jgi:Skp family chaperone for outer membrane proteins